MENPLPDSIEHLWYCSDDLHCTAVRLDQSLCTNCVYPPSQHADMACAVLQQYGALLSLDDSMRHSRLSYILLLRQADSMPQPLPGLAALMHLQRGSRHLWRRLALFRLVHFVTRDYPDLVGPVW